jgi:hypothetical protein
LDLPVSALLFVRCISCRFGSSSLSAQDSQAACQTESAEMAVGASSCPDPAEKESSQDLKNRITALNLGRVFVYLLGLLFLLTVALPFLLSAKSTLFVCIGIFLIAVVLFFAILKFARWYERYFLEND